MDPKMSVIMRFQWLTTNPDNNSNQAATIMEQHVVSVGPEK